VVLLAIGLLGERGLALGSCAELRASSLGGGAEERRGMKPMFGVEGWGTEVVIGRCGGEREESEISSGLACGIEASSGFLQSHSGY